ncbi:response regulator transcription factor [Luteimonas viscosa]|uniref:Response regulator transcription factor n=1 Tax=Luteimonas viscosa TaxID=1132694 RepID=A0A5D4XSQ7_9GAMM|nr:response regulator transcription factor [Luteimonas viscosa]TYT27003.1 response regulator transcription factor [Luteimonas viscosa]
MKLRAPPLRLLLVEDDVDIAAGIGDYLGRHGVVVDFAYNAAQARARLQAQPFDLAVLDVNLPDQNGMALCQSLKREGGMRAPVLFLTARGSLDDKLAAFAAGAVDYMVKPFAPAELLARARAITTHTAHAGGPQLRVGAYVLDIQRHLLARGDDSLPLHGTGLVLMRALMEASPGSVSRQVLCERLWQGDPPDSDPLRMHVYQLRQHCLRAFGVPLIANVRGVGYRFSGEPMDAPA